MLVLLLVGMYIVIIIDFFGCEVEVIYEIIEFVMFNVFIFMEDVSCFGDCDGFI